jgi:hypothetical protein
MSSKTVKKELVNRPAHYQADNGQFQVVDVIEQFGLNAHQAHAMTYTLRAGRKDNNIVQDKRKALWWLVRDLKFNHGVTVTVDKEGNILV